MRVNIIILEEPFFHIISYGISCAVFYFMGMWFCRDPPFLANITKSNALLTFSNKYKHTIWMGMLREFQFQI